eukprot:TRINITY_DN55637_c0_g1_i1.p1 TRINITY_DN55637_c0_g1~~TRINITY_DN55637_c0_g1_i1.p1  ORF type:complete len:896 (+),score=138.30 TRINITY_DN55637_c0_g1_i1:208-2895(+)
MHSKPANDAGLQHGQADAGAAHARLAAGILNGSLHKLLGDVAGVLPAAIGAELGDPVPALDGDLPMLDPDASLERPSMSHWTVVSVPLFGAFVALMMVIVLRTKIANCDRGQGKQLEVARRIQVGAIAFLKAEYFWLVPFVLAMAAAMVPILESTTYPELLTTTDGKMVRTSWVVAHAHGWKTAASFLLGATFSAASGWAGMMTATDTSVRTTEAAKEGLMPAFHVALAGGGVIGFSVIFMGLLGLSLLFLLWTWDESPQLANRRLDFLRGLESLAGFSFGASSIALFARVAGGIYTKAADVGADLVGKVECDIPEDDPRNPAAIADNVGDNVGDVAGMGADLFESFVGSIVAAASLGAMGVKGYHDENTLKDVAFPFWVAGSGVVASAVGFMFLSLRPSLSSSQQDLLRAMHMGVYMTAASMLIFSALSSWLIYSDKHYWFTNATVTLDEVLRRYGCVVIGLITGVLIGESTERSTSYAYFPTRSIANAGITGPGTVVIQGLGVGMLSTVPPVVVIAGAIMTCYSLINVYGVSLAAVGMLSTLAMTLATDAYGPIADNAGGIVEMSSDIPDVVRARTDMLDALGNTTAATGKGFAIGSAVLSAIAFLNAFHEHAAFTTVVPLDVHGMKRDANGYFSLTSPVVLSGLLVGAVLPYLFAGLTMLSVRKAASAVIQEARRQFRDIPGLLEGKPGAEPDVERCVMIVTNAALKETVVPALLAVMTPFSAGLLVGARFLGGLLMGSIASGFMLALTMANAGGAWDNAKKYVENENPIIGGRVAVKGRSIHKACVVGDTVGDPFKDTSGPALNVLLNLMGVIALTFARLWPDDWATWRLGLVVLTIQVGLISAALLWAWLTDSDIGDFNEDELPIPPSRRSSMVALTRSQTQSSSHDSMG